MMRYAICTLLLVGSVSARPADLLEIFRAAQSSDAVYAAARAVWTAGQEKLPQGRAGLLPSVTFSASTQYNERDLRFRDPRIPGSNAPFNSNAITLSLSQPIFRRQNTLVYEQAKSQVVQSDAVFAQAAQDLILRVAQAYFDVLLAQNTVELAAAQLVAIGQQLEQAKRNFEVGTATITDTHDAQARYDLTVAGEIAAKNDLEVKKRALAQIIGRTAPPLATVGPKFPLTGPEPDNMEAWVTEAVASNLQVLVTQAALDFAVQEVGRNRAAHLPTLDVIASYTEAGTGSGINGGPGSDTTTKVIGLQLAVPLYQGGLVNSRVREALANEEKARQDLDNARRSAELAARQSFLGVTSGIAQVKALQQALVSSQSSLDSSRLGQEVGVRTQVDVLNAQQLLFQTRRDLAQAVYNYLISVLRLKAAVGKLSEDDIARINTWLERP
ncbi:MAG TPA: TolC family outer membrane protein [Burkholderiales bacterium]|nr:TolC family outer membrane protein [Burkholderiales bacterium]